MAAASPVISLESTACTKGCFPAKPQRADNTLQDDAVYHLYSKMTAEVARLLDLLLNLAACNRLVTAKAMMWAAFPCQASIMAG